MRNVDVALRADELYTLREFKRRMGLSESAWRALKARGFPVSRSGKRVFVSGRLAITYYEHQVDRQT